MAGVSQPSLLEEHADAISISALYDRVELAVSKIFPRGRTFWVRGEVQSITDRTGHCYIDLIDPDGIRDKQSPVLKVKCWRTSWEPMRLRLESSGVVLEEGMVVLLRGHLDFYKPRAELGFVLAEVDVAALLGRLAQRRAALIELLRREDLLEQNRRIPVPMVPLRVGLVASPGTEGHDDFVGRLESSGFAFEVVLTRAQVQGGQAPSSIAGALVALARRHCDVIVIVRGGGSKADLAAFDTEPVARAIAVSPVPVWVGIGHTGDSSVADIVANRSFVTPTECGQELVGKVRTWWDSVSAEAVVIARRAQDVLDSVKGRDDNVRSRLAASAQRQLDRHAERNRDRAYRLARSAPRQIEGCAAKLVLRADRVGALCNVALDRQADRLAACRRLVRAYDVERQLERGYSITLDSSGRLVRSVAQLAEGDVVTTRFGDGIAESSVLKVIERAGAVHDGNEG